MVRIIICGFFILFLATPLVQAQQWAWLSGSNTPNATGDSIYYPGARTGSFSWSDSSNKLYVFGGSSSEGDYNDLWCFDRNIGEWSFLGGSINPNDPGAYSSIGDTDTVSWPRSRSLGASWIDSQGNLWLMGGYSGGFGWYNDLWRYSTSQGNWVWLGGSQEPFSLGSYGEIGVESVFNEPASRHICSYWQLGDSFYLLGGIGGAPGSGIYLNDLWRFSSQTQQWTLLSGNSATGVAPSYGQINVPSMSNNPGSRFGSATWMSQDGDSLYLFGGGNGPMFNQSFNNDLWLFHLPTLSWTWISGPSTPGDSGDFGFQGVSSTTNRPPARLGSVSFSEGNYLWLFGGSVGDGYCNDLWRFNKFTYEWTWIGGSNNVNDSGLYINEDQGYPFNYPSNRLFGAFCAANDGTNWMFGGTSISMGEGPINDLWVFDSNSLSDQTECVIAEGGGPYSTCGQNATALNAMTDGPGQWSGGFGTFADPSQPNTTYTPAASEIGSSVTLTWTTNDPDGYGPCNSATDQALVTVNEPGTSNPTTPITICNGSTASLQVTTTLATGVWSGGSGTFSPPDSPTSTYTPGASDIGNTNLVLTWTTLDPFGPCPAITVSQPLSVIGSTTAEAAGPYSVCGATPITLNATANGDGQWTGGTGTFSDATLISTTYTPELNEIGTAVTLTWTTDPDGAGPCVPASDQAVLTILTPAIADAGGPYVSCNSGPIILNATTDGPGQWSGGSGTFADPSQPNTTYTPACWENSGVTLTWTTFDPDGAGPCAAAEDNATIISAICGAPIIIEQPIPSQINCAGEQAQTLSVNVCCGTEWFVSGFQWYCSLQYGYGGNAEPILGATAASFTPPLFFQPGIRYYYCEVYYSNFNGACPFFFFSDLSNISQINTQPENSDCGGGCLDSTACNYNPQVTFDDGSCTYGADCFGCTDANASNYQPQAVFNEGCEYTTTITVYHDTNGDGVQQSNEPGMSNWSVYIPALNATVFTNNSGIATLNVTPNTYSIELINNSTVWMSSSPTVLTIDIPTIVNASFGVIPATGEAFYAAGPYDGFWDIIHCEDGYEAGVFLNNLGTVDLSGTLTLICDAMFTPEQDSYSSISPDQVAAGFAQWNINAFAAGSNGIFSFHIDGPGPVNIGSTYNFEFHLVLNDAEGNVIYDNTWTTSPFIACAYDPNDLTATPIGYEAPHFVLAGDRIQYRVRFQNTGNLPAEDVRIVGALDPAKFDLSTFAPLYGSAPFVTCLLNNGSIDFTFNDIYLPDATNNEPESHGFVVYEVSLLPGVDPNEVVLNQASIYFDSNPAIVTNETYHTIFDCTSFTPMTGGTSVCEGETITFTANQPYVETYTWSIDGAADSDNSSGFQTTLAPGVHSVLLNTANPLCSEDHTATVVVHGTPELTMPADTAFCLYSIIELAAVGNGSIIWTNDINNNGLFEVTGSQTLNATLTSPEGCIAEGEWNIEALPLPFIEYTVDGLQLTALSGEAWQWYLNGQPIAGATSNSYTMLAGGAYSVEVTNISGCSAMSGVTNYILGVLEAEALGIRVYPNPMENELRIDLPSQGAYHIELRDITGRLISTRSQCQGSCALQREGAASGIYELLIKGEGVYAHQRVVLR